MKARRRACVLASAAAAIVASAALVSCRSLSKDEVEERLLALPKNAGFREIGLTRRTMTIPIGGADVAAEVTFLRTPAGAAPRPVVVLVHGTPGSLFTWGDV